MTFFSTILCQVNDILSFSLVPGQLDSILPAFHRLMTFFCNLLCQDKGVDVPGQHNANLCRFGKVDDVLGQPNARWPDGAS